MLLRNKMIDALHNCDATDPAWNNGKGLFLIDGFPRKTDQMVLFEETVSEGLDFFLYY